MWAAEIARAARFGGPLTNNLKTQKKKLVSESSHLPESHTGSPSYWLTGRTGRVVCERKFRGRTKMINRTSSSRLVGKSRRTTDIHYYVLLGGSWAWELERYSWLKWSLGCSPGVARTEIEEDSRSRLWKYLPASSVFITFNNTTLSPALFSIILLPWIDRVTCTRCTKIFAHSVCKSRSFMD